MYRILFPSNKLISIFLSVVISSFGQTAIFLIGGDSKACKPTPVFLQSGDVVVMSGKSRLSYHGVPKILKSDQTPWLSIDADPSNESELTYQRTEYQDGAKRIKLDENRFNCNLCSFTSSTSLSPFSKDLSFKWNEFLTDYISKCRINLNVRKVLF